MFLICSQRLGESSREKRREDMSAKKLIRKLKRALPVVVANAPAVIAAVIEVKRAVKSAPRPQTGDSAA
jgi:hypothetical protein